MGSGFLDVFFAEDISERGLAIRVPHGFSGCDITDSVDLIITIPRVPAFKARGMVRRTVRSPDRTLFGVELTEIAPKNQAAIARYVEAMMALGRGA